MGLDKKERLILRGLYEMQAQTLHILQSIDLPDKKELYKALSSLDVKVILARMEVS